MDRRNNVTQFVGYYAFLSNFYFSPFAAHDGFLYGTVEHYFQAAKTLVPNEKTVIRAASTPGDAKRLGRKCTLRKDWEEVKVDVMREALKLKFRSSSLRNKLSVIKIGLIESNYWHDNIWGDCDCEKCEDILGQNLLGKLLMELRDGGR